mmetsp:Transcript_10965/g.40184  ORF Transcript_10965/g.40184 Transcript_10965/m.40184 type:complete len:361 (-) Transcript_10965:1074-2156(-)
MNEKHGEEEEAQELDGAGNTIDHIVLHSCKYLSGDDNGIDNGRKARSCQHDISCCSCCICCSGNCYADIGFLQRRCIVYPISGHTNQVAPLAQRLNDQEFVLWVHLSETIRFFDKISVVSAQSARDGLVNVIRRKLLRTTYGSAHAEDSAHFNSNRLLIASYHFYVNAHFIGRLDRGLRVWARRIQEAHDAQKLEARAAFFRPSHRQRPDATFGEIHDRVAGVLADGPSPNTWHWGVLVVKHINDYLGRTLRGLECWAASLGSQGGFSTLDLGVEGQILDLLVGVQGGQIDRIQGQRVEGVLGWLLPFGSQGSRGQHVMSGNLRPESQNHLLLQVHLVQRQRACLVRAQHGHARELFHCG